MTLEEKKCKEVKEAYIKKFGGYPEYLLMGASNKVIIEKLSKCLETGEILRADYPKAVY